jgi:hypothetical protein
MHRIAEGAQVQGALRQLEQKYPGLRFSLEINVRGDVASFGIVSGGATSARFSQSVLSTELRRIIEDCTRLYYVEESRVLLENGWQIRTTVGNTTTYGPDYPGIARRSSRALAPLVSAIRDTAAGSEREQLANALALFQSIPYNTLNDDARTNGVGFAVPVELLITNLGDCDTKSCAFVAVAHELLPDSRKIFILIPKHAFVGIEMDVDRGDQSVTYDGVRYVIMEPVGPSLRPMGQVAESSVRAFNARRDVRILSA